MLRLVDRDGPFAIVKHLNGKGLTLGWQIHKIFSGPVIIGETTKLFDRANTLAEAREKIGKIIVHPIKETQSSKDVWAMTQTKKAERCNKKV